MYSAHITGRFRPVMPKPQYICVPHVTRSVATNPPRMTNSNQNRLSVRYIGSST
jgi:hypothetical protein